MGVLLDLVVLVFFFEEILCDLVGLYEKMSTFYLVMISSVSRLM